MSQFDFASIANEVAAVQADANVAKAGGGSIVFTPKSGANALVAGTIPTDRISWDCKTGGSLAAKYRPSECRGT